ncbi:MAG: sigma-70 family RNA polymerase sigma factor [Chitinophagales bacterium]|nr:sigma-70 family RNA polymerase sigma factor [Chitinophagales bacterium]
MSTSKRTVSAAEMQNEWLEVQAAQQDSAMFQPLYERYFESIYLYIFRRIADEELAADICSQVFLKAMQRLYSYEYKGVPFSAWLYRIASNEVAQHFRKAKKNRIVSIDDANVVDMFEDIDEPVELPSQEELVVALDKLKEDDLQLIELRYFEGLPYKEIAEILDITENNAKVKTFRILNRLKKKLG